MSSEEPELLSLGVIRFSGPDASSFLQGQLTSDVTREDATTQLSACTTPQGRVMAILRLARRVDAIYALLPAVLVAPMIDRMRKYVLRAKVAIDALDGWSIVWANRERGSSPAVRDVPESHVEFEYPDGRVAVARPGKAPADAGAGNLWHAADIAAGLPQITAETSGHFVPQMLNLDLLGAISFEKGCYTGQEIVARTQNLGRVKRRMLRYRLRTDAAPAPMSALHHEAVKVGEVLMSAAVDDGVELLAVVALDARDRPLRTATGHTAMPMPLPYVV